MYFQVLPSHACSDMSPLHLGISRNTPSKTARPDGYTVMLFHPSEWENTVSSLLRAWRIRRHRQLPQILSPGIPTRTFGIRLHCLKNWFLSANMTISGFSSSLYAPNSFGYFGTNLQILLFQVRHYMSLILGRHLCSILCEFLWVYLTGKIPG